MNSNRSQPGLKVVKRKHRPATPGPTREKLLEVAGPIFVDRGYRATTIREICSGAGALVNGALTCRRHAAARTMVGAAALIGAGELQLFERIGDLMQMLRGQVKIPGRSVRNLMNKHLRYAADVETVFSEMCHRA